MYTLMLHLGGPSEILVLLGFFHLTLQRIENCPGTSDSDIPVMGHRRFRWPPDILVQLISAELVQFSVSLSSFFVFCFARAFYLILGT